MCGIAALFENSHAEESAVADAREAWCVAMAAMASRGPHGWGATDGSCTVHRIGAVGIAAARDAAWRMDGPALVGHTRYATRGDARNPANLHPFRARSGWQFVHNGTFEGEHAEVCHAVDSPHLIAYVDDAILRRSSPTGPVGTGYGTIVGVSPDGREGAIWCHDGDLTATALPGGILLASVPVEGIGATRWVRPPVENGGTYVARMRGGRLVLSRVGTVRVEDRWASRWDATFVPRPPRKDGR